MCNLKGLSKLGFPMGKRGIKMGAETAVPGSSNLIERTLKYYHLWDRVGEALMNQYPDIDSEFKLAIFPKFTAEKYYTLTAAGAAAAAGDDGAAAREMNNVFSVYHDRDVALSALLTTSPAARMQWTTMQQELLSKIQGKQQGLRGDPLRPPVTNKKSQQLWKEGWKDGEAEYKTMLKKTTTSRKRSTKRKTNRHESAISSSDAVRAPAEQSNANFLPVERSQSQRRGETQPGAGRVRLVSPRISS